MKTTLLIASVVIALQGFSQTHLEEPFSADYILTEVNLPIPLIIPDDLQSNKVKLDSTASKHYNPSDHSWYEGTQTKYAYFEDGNIKSVKITYPGIGMEITQFNEDRSIHSMTYKGWNGTEFVNMSRKDFFHSSLGKKADSTYSWDGSQWQLSGYSKFFYDAQDQLTQKLGYEKVGNQFEPATKAVFHYTTNGKLEELHTFNNTNTFWEPSYRYYYTYNGLDQLSKYIYERWNSGVWSNEFRADYLYANNNMIEMKTYSWDNNSWTHILLEERQYDNETTTDAVWLPEDLRANTNQIVGKQTYLYQNGMYAYGDSTIYYYKSSTINSVEDDLELDDFTILGNPFHNELVLSNEGAVETEVAVYSITGQQVYYGIHQEDIIRIQMEAIQPGTYIIHYKQDKKHKVKKATKY